MDHLQRAERVQTWLDAERAVAANCEQGRLVAPQRTQSPCKRNRLCATIGLKRTDRERRVGLASRLRPRSSVRISEHRYIWTSLLATQVRAYMPEGTESGSGVG